MRRVVMVVALLLLTSACGGSVDTGFPAGQPSGSDSTTGGDGGGDPTETTVDTTSGDGGQTVTTIQEALEPEPGFPLLDDALAAAAGTPRADTAIGSPDIAAAAAISEALSEQIDPTGLEVWVFPVVGSDEVLLVLEIDGSAVDEDAEGTDFDLLSFLSSDPNVIDAGVTRFVANFHAIDEEGEVVLTTTIPIAAIIEAVANDTDVADDAVVFQVLRSGGSK